LVASGPFASAAPAHADDEAETEPLRAELHVGTGAVHDVTPGWTQALTASAGAVLWDTALVEAGLWWSSPTFEGRQQTRVVGARLDACGLLPQGRVEWRGCVGLALGDYRLHDREREVDVVESTLWLAFAGGAGVTHWFDGFFGVGVMAEALVPLLREPLGGMRAPSPGLAITVELGLRVP
jgi:hypothetical protein